MKVICVYTYPLNGQGQYLELALKFLQSYADCPPGLDHETVVVCNGAPATDETMFLFGSLPNLKLLEHDNSGWDLGAFQHAARDNPQADLMVFFGASAYLKGGNWLQRMVQAYQKRGPSLYGSMGNRGDCRFNVHAHLRTTGMWMAPAVMNQYPHVCSKPEHRYPMEHGPDCLTSWVKRKGMLPWLVSWESEFQEADWDSVPNGFRQGDQSNILVGDRLTRQPYGVDP